MRAAIGNFWENANSSLWLVPALLTLGAVVLFTLLLAVDTEVAPDLDERVPWLFGGTAEAARTLLQVISGSLITVVSIAFSITIVALQQASTQFSPRVLRSFTSDRGNQVVLGTYIATFTYALLVMGEVRDETGDQAGFVPSLSVSVAIVLALVSLGMLIYFIHHISQALQVSWILASSQSEAEAEMNSLFPSQIGRGGTDPPSVEKLVEQTEREQRGHETLVHSEEAGYLRRVDPDQLARATQRGVYLLCVLPRIGDFLQHGSVIARLWSEAPLPEQQRKQVRGAFTLDRERSTHQDLITGIREMVDIAVKALSPSVNDPTTAEQCLDYLGDVLVRLAGREFPSPLRRMEHGPLFLFNRPDFDDHVDAAFSQIRRAARDEPHVTGHLLSLLGQLAERVPNPGRAIPIRRQVEEVVAGLEVGDLSQSDRQSLREQARGILMALSRRWEQPQQAA